MSFQPPVGRVPIRLLGIYDVLVHKPQLIELMFNILYNLIIVGDSFVGDSFVGDSFVGDSNGTPFFAFLKII